eukprot:TRINITY_DN32232_c0_g1_i1.p1 TRINITY_DN32232_c0_g1~~TRINITY_DN32232_c0_g1_i1.p1  ORF type:complete len:773 (+),score=51.87 TRINITY_DN32232_c0_g1_i1:249-2321(+)
MEWMHMWLAGTGKPAVLRGQMIAWINQHEGNVARYYCRISYCHYHRHHGYHRCEAQQAEYKGSHGNRKCPPIIYVKNLCPTIAPSETHNSQLSRAYCERKTATAWGICRSAQKCVEQYEGSCSASSSCECGRDQCLVENKCRSVSADLSNSFQRTKPYGIDVCINSKFAPTCAEGSIPGWIYKNRLRILWDVNATIRECEYAIFNCKTSQYLGFAWDTAIECAWKRVKNRVASLAPASPEMCPSISLAATTKSGNSTRLTSHNQLHTYISFGVSLDYLQAQFVKSWGAGGPMRTSYDTCAAQKCDFTCTEKIETCSFACCQNSRFLDEYGHLRNRRGLGEVPNHSFADLCYLSGFSTDPMLHLEETSALFEQKITGGSLVALKLMMTPPFSIWASVSPTEWLIFGIGAALSDWIMAHVTQTSFQSYVAQFPLYDGHAFAILKGKGIAISAEDFRLKSGSEVQDVPVLCRLSIGFVFVFLRCLVNTLGALFGTTLSNGLLGIDTAEAQKEDVFRLTGPIRALVGNAVRQYLDESPVGVFLLGLFSGQILGSLLGGLMWQIQNLLGRIPLEFVASTVLANLFTALIVKTSVCRTSHHTAEDHTFDDTLSAMFTTTSDFLEHVDKNVSWSTSAKQEADVLHLKSMFASVREVQNPGKPLMDEAQQTAEYELWATHEASRYDSILEESHEYMGE